MSHLASGDGPGGALAPFAFACLAVASWRLRPASRRLVPAPMPAAQTDPVRPASEFTVS